MSFVFWIGLQSSSTIGGTIGHASGLRRFSTQGLPVRVSVFEPPSGPAKEFYAPYAEADLGNAAFVSATLEGLRDDKGFAEKLIQPKANYGGINGEELKALLIEDQSLLVGPYNLKPADPSDVFNHKTPNGRRGIARGLIVEASISVTSALLMADELAAMPVADDSVYPRLLALRAGSRNYVGGTPSLAPLLGLQFARAVIPDEVLKKMDFKDIFEYRKETKDIYEAWSVEINSAAAKIDTSDFDDPSKAIQSIVVGELLPKLREYENEMASVRDKLFAELVKGITTWQLPTITAAYFTNIGHQSALTIFAELAAIIGTGAKAGVGPVVDYVSSRRDVRRRHGMSYLVGLSNR